MDAFGTFYAGWSIAISGVVGVCIAISIFKRAKQEPGFLGRPFGICVAVTALLSIATYVLHPFVFTRPGVWGQELIAYAMLCGVLVGGTLALLSRKIVRPSKSSESNVDA